MMEETIDFVKAIPTTDARKMVYACQITKVKSWADTQSSYEEWLEACNG